ncbi:MAG: arginine--tRNA ligase [Patescibacteria group bacterium]
MYFLDDLKLKIVTALELERANFSYPPNIALGDLSLACFELAKSRDTKPTELATRLAHDLKNNSNLNFYFLDIKAVGPYLNFFISPVYLAAAVISEIRAQRENYGFNQVGRHRRVMVEYSNGNTHKEYHVGHLRNISYGDSVVKLLQASGYVTIPVSYVNDFGIHVAKTIWHWQHNPVFDERPEAKGYLLGHCYAKASQLLADNPEGKKAVTAIMKEIESRQGNNYKFWQISRQWSIDYFASIYRELDIKFDHIFYESEVISAGLKLAEELFQTGVLVKSEGAIIANLEKYDLGVLPIIRSDGTALYPVGDLALASEKFKKYHLDESIYVIDVRQSLYFKQLFKILELTGYQPAVSHLSYDFVTLPGGMMSSRTGNIITYDELKNKIVDKLLIETKKRHPRWSEYRLLKVVGNLSVSIIKFEMLKVGAAKTITFNIEEALRFDGYTACYLQYTYARLKSIIRKAGLSRFFRRVDLKLLSEPSEKALLLKIAKYPELIKETTQKYDPSELAKYLFELAQLSNDYYHRVNILKSTAVLQVTRLSLIRSVSQVLFNGYKILGLKISEEM